MRWVDVCGPPGSGKSTLCDHVWDPHAIAYDGLGLPREWQTWWVVCVDLMDELRDHPTFEALRGMTLRSMRKMASVLRREDASVYIQTGVAQRGLGFGWRLAQAGKVQKVRRFFDLMPASLGVAVVTCPVETARSRNLQRTQVAETAHENREHMVPFFAPAIEVLKEVMSERGVSLIEIDTTKPITDARWDLLRFAADRATAAEKT